MEELKNLKEAILRDYPRMGSKDRFNFECGPHLSCYNQCCADVNIFLTPYDVLRMRKHLGLGSADFLGKYTLVPFDKSQKLPVPLFKMTEDDAKRCHFVDDEKGCTIYEHRPWPCRIYPLGQASPGEAAGKDQDDFFFIMAEDFCKGHEKQSEWSVEEWIEDQGIAEYNKWGELFKYVTVHPHILGDTELKPEQVDMYWTALYDLDKFRMFILNSTFMDRFDISEKRKTAIETDDEELLRLGFEWTRMALFGEKVIPVRDTAIDELKAKKESEVDA